MKSYNELKEVIRKSIKEAGDLPECFFETLYSFYRLGWDECVENFLKTFIKKGGKND